uniref:Short chain dehydrogenase rstn4 n=1 Tax=Aspergillus nomiae NRRL (strain ATCC 15546 / NRRL 13137 / CBS 260.88 / M93) TaxID=1509407 RepID=RSTN4_ASPN3
MAGYLPEPLRMMVTNPAISDFTSDGPLPYALRQKFTGWPPPPAAADISLASQTVLVTGATSGVGLEAARQLAQLGPRLLILGARNLSKADGVKRQLEQDTPHVAVQVAKLDLEDLSSVDRFVDGLHASAIHLDLALLNAGFFANDDRMTPDGYSSLFQVNFLSTAYLAFRLLPLLQTTTTAPEASPQGPRLVLVTSEAHAWTTFPVPPEPAENSLPILSSFRQKESLGSADDQYYRAKLLLALIGKELSRRLTTMQMATSVVITTPGFCASNFFPDSVMTRLIQLISARSIQQGGALHVFAATAQGPQMHGAYLRDGKPTGLSKFAEGPQGQILQQRLWVEMEQFLAGRGYLLSSILKPSSPLQIDGPV